MIQDSVNLAHQCDGSLQRRCLGELDVDDEVALVFIGQKRSRKRSPDSSRHSGESDKDYDGQHEFADEQAGDINVTPGGAFESGIEDGEPSSEWSPSRRAALLTEEQRA